MAYRRMSTLYCGFLLVALVGCMQPRSPLRAADSQLAVVGTWRLLEYVAWDSTGTPRHLFGSPPSGYAVFDAAGSAFIQIMKIGDASSLAAYYGSFSVNPSGDSLSIRVEGSNIPSYLQTIQRRPFRIRGDTLVLGVTGQYRATLLKAEGR